MPDTTIPPDCRALYGTHAQVLKSGGLGGRVDVRLCLGEHFQSEDPDPQLVHHGAHRVEESPHTIHQMPERVRHPARHG